MLIDGRVRVIASAVPSGFRLLVLIQDPLGVELLVPGWGVLQRVVVADQYLRVPRNLFRSPREKS